jgi:hypothetical protein
VLAPAVGREEVGHGGRIAPTPGSVVAKIDPDPPFLKAAGTTNKRVQGSVFKFGQSKPTDDDSDQKSLQLQKTALS